MILDLVHSTRGRHATYGSTISVYGADCRMETLANPSTLCRLEQHADREAATAFIRSCSTSSWGRMRRCRGPSGSGCRRHGPEIMPVRFGELWGAYVGPGAAGDREGRAYHLGIQSALRGDQPDADRLLSLRPDVLCTREHGVTASKVSQLDTSIYSKQAEVDNPYMIKNHTLISVMIRQNSNK